MPSANIARRLDALEAARAAKPEPHEQRLHRLLFNRALLAGGGDTHALERDTHEPPDLEAKIKAIRAAMHGRD